jgi:hypothetical protein
VYQLGIDAPFGLILRGGAATERRQPLSIERVFYASTEKRLTGPVVDQADILPEFRDSEIQDSKSGRAVRAPSP